MFEKILQILTLLLTVGGSIVTTLYGFKAISKSFDSKLEKAVLALHEALRGKLDVAVYSAKVKELHDKNNDLAQKLAATEREVKTLNDLLALIVRQQN